MKKIIFLDLDGTVRETKSGAKFINDPFDQELIQGVSFWLKKFRKEGFILVGITNQGGIAAGYKSLESAISEQKFTLQLAPQIDSILFCSDFEGEQCFMVNRQVSTQITAENFPFIAIGNMRFRKPEPGMIEFILANNEGVDREQCLMFGDRAEDEECARNAGINFKWARALHFGATSSDLKDPIFQDNDDLCFGNYVPED